MRKLKSRTRTARLKTCVLIGRGRLELPIRVRGNPLIVAFALCYVYAIELNRPSGIRLTADELRTA